MSAIADILERTADLIEPEGAWTQGADARGRTGREVDPLGRAAVCWCVSGAIARTVGDWNGSNIGPAFRIVDKTVGTQSISNWNDAPERAQAEVVAKLREAAKIARGEQP